MSARLNSKGEEVWQDLRQHLDWNDGFALVFLFASDVRLTDIFKQRLQQFYIGHSTRLQEILYENTSDWLEQSMSRLLNRDEQWQLMDAPVWVALHHTQDQYALEQYRQLLMRLNERRDLWRAQYPAPMFFILPEMLKPHIGGLVPDLWSIRLLADDLSGELLSENVTQPVTQGAERPQQTQEKIGPGMKIPEKEQLVIDEWQRLQQILSDKKPVETRWFSFFRKKNTVSQVFRREYLIIADRARAAYQKYAYLDQARTIAETMVEQARKLAEKDTPESLRDLSVSLDNAGDVAKQQGRWGDAQMAYEESLGIRRRLKELLGDTPESLRDLPVSLNKLGDVAKQQGRWGDAQMAYEESLGIRRRLKELLGDTPESLRDLPVSLNKLGDVAKQQGRWGDAQMAYEESLGIRRRLKELLGDTPESLRDLSVSLDNAGDVAKQQGRWGDAQMAYEESLGIRRRLKELLGDTPESLRDLAISNQNLGLLNEALENREEAAQYFYHELALGKRLTEMLPDYHHFTEIESFSRRKIKELTGAEAE